MYKQVWISNVKKLLAQNNLSISEAARLIGTSKQYLSTILSDSEPQSTKDQIIERLSFLLHASPSMLYALDIPQAKINPTVSQASIHAEEASSAPELAILAERHFLAQDYEGCQTVVSKLLTEYSMELSPAAKAQAWLLAGKCSCLLGQSDKARAHLRDALALFQKRLSAQPTKYLPLCMDAYRYLALAEYADEQYIESVRYYQRIFVIAKRYPELSTELLGKVENAGNGLLRAAVKQGKLSAVIKAANEVEAFAADHAMASLATRAAIERAFCTFVATSTIDLSSLNCANCSSEPLAALQYGILLWENSQHQKLANHIERLRNSNQSELTFVARWLQALLTQIDEANLTELAELLEEEWPSIYRSLLQALRAARLDSKGDGIRAAYLWHDALFTLKQNKEIAFYLFVLRWYMRKIGAELSSNFVVLQSLLSLTVEEFSQ